MANKLVIILMVTTHSTVDDCCHDTSRHQLLLRMLIYNTSSPRHKDLQFCNDVFMSKSHKVESRYLQEKVTSLQIEVCV